MFLHCWEENLPELQEGYPSMAKLDRFLFSIGWHDKFLTSSQQGLASQLSDHCPILLDTREDRQFPSCLDLKRYYCKLKDLQTL